MIYDCFIFNDELDLLELRLQFLYNTVDRFVLVESERSLSGNKKKLHFKENSERFRRYADKIIYVEAPLNNLPAWEYEYFQRNYIKEGLKNCDKDDIIFISDADEIINIKEVLNVDNLKLPAVIELPMYYYFLNLKTNYTYKVNLAANCSFIEKTDLGQRLGKYELLTDNIISSKKTNTGWHFSYLYGYEIEKYQEKIKSFSHQEYNNNYYLNYKRIKRCVIFKIDLFERSFMSLNQDNRQMETLQPFFEKTNLSSLFYKQPSLKQYLNLKALLFVIYFKFIKQPGFHIKKFLFNR